MQQPQPQPILNPIAHLLGNAHVRATANGVPVNLPPELINNLLNQHFQQSGQLPNLLATIQQAQQNQQRQAAAAAQQRLHHLQHLRDQIPPEQEQQRQAIDSQIAHLQQQMAAQEQEANERRAAEREQGEEEAQPADETPPRPERQSSNESLNSNGAEQQVNVRQASPGAAVNASPARNGASATANASQEPPTDATAAAPVNDQNQPRIVTRSGVNPDGSRWTQTMTTTVNEQNGQPHHHHHLPPGVPMFAAPQFPHQHIPGLPTFAQPQFPAQQVPFPFMQHPAAIPARVATPPAGLRPGGTPRSVSPARSISEGQRRVGTPAAELQNRLESTRREIENVNRLLGVMQTGNMANGAAAPPLSPENRQELQTFAASMVSHIDGFGADLGALANALHPSVRAQPEFVALQQLYQSVHAQGRAIQRQVSNIASPDGPSRSLRGGAGSPAGSTGPERSLQPPTSHPAETSIQPVAASPQTSAATATPLSSTSEFSNTPITLAVPQNVPTTAPTPELHLLTDPSGTPQALVVGPTGQYASSPLPAEILYGLLAAQLPHDQLLQDFNQIMREALNPPAHIPAIGLPNLPANNGNVAAGFVQHQQAANLNGIRLRRLLDHLNGQQAQQQPQAAGAQAALPGQQPAPAAGARNGQNQARDLLDPLMRHLWVTIKIAVFAYFFLASGRGYWRLLLIGGAGLIIYALNTGWFGQNMEGAWNALRRHFDALINAPQQEPMAVAAGEGHGNGEGPAGDREPNPQAAARRLVEQQQGRNRAWVQNRARQFERTIALFVASLWPGVGENVIQAQERARQEEQRRRDEAEAEAKRKEEEAKKKADEEASVENGLGNEAGPSTDIAEQPFGKSAATGTDAGPSAGLSRVNKGKGRASDEDVEKYEGKMTDSGVGTEEA